MRLLVLALLSYTVFGCYVVKMKTPILGKDCYEFLCTGEQPKLVCNGLQGVRGAGVECILEELVDDGRMLELSCGGGVVGSFLIGIDGLDGESIEDCTVTSSEDRDFDVSCSDIGASISHGVDGKDGTACEFSMSGGEVLLTCGEDKTIGLNSFQGASGNDGELCTVYEETLTCGEMSTTTGTIGENGDTGKSCKVRPYTKMGSKCYMIDCWESELVCDEVSTLCYQVEDKDCTSLTCGADTIQLCPSTTAGHEYVLIASLLTGFYPGHPHVGEGVNLNVEVAFYYSKRDTLGFLPTIPRGIQSVEIGVVSDTFPKLSHRYMATDREGNEVWLGSMTTDAHWNQVGNLYSSTRRTFLNVYDSGYTSYRYKVSITTSPSVTLTPLNTVSVSINDA